MALRPENSGPAHRGALALAHLADRDFEVRHSALRVLSSRMSDETVFTAILNQASKEPVGWVRLMLYRELTRQRKDDSRVRDLLIERARNEENHRNREGVLTILATRYADDPEAREGEEERDRRRGHQGGAQEGERHPEQDLPRRRPERRAGLPSLEARRRARSSAVPRLRAGRRDGRRAGAWAARATRRPS